MVLTKNERKILRYLASTITKNQSINEVGKACGVSSGGAFKILKKLEREHIVQSSPMANIKVYKLDFQGESTESALQIAFVPEGLEGRIKLRAEDLSPLKSLTQVCVMFGSYITAKQDPGDVDVLFVLDRKNFDKYHKALEKAKDIIPIKVQDVIQTVEDLEDNLRKGDPVIASIIRTGIVLWGSDKIVEVIKNASR